MEDKQHILGLLLPALQATKGLSDLTELRYENLCSEWVVAEFRGGKSKKISVEGDSGLAMINDVLSAITRY